MLDGIAPIILAGGKSSRMGRDKSFVAVAEQPLIERVIGCLRQTFSRPPLIVTNRPQHYEHLRLAMIGDQICGQGPLGGIHAGLCAIQEPYAFVVACDMPFLDPRLICHMAERAAGYQVVMPRDGAATEALHAVYHTSCRDAIERCLAEGRRRIVDFLPQVTVRYIEAAEYAPYCWGRQPFFNVNDGNDLQLAQRLWLKQEKEKGVAGSCGERQRNA